MHIVFDERVVDVVDTRGLLLHWYAILQAPINAARGIVYSVNKDFVRTPIFLSRFNELPKELKALLSPMLFGSQLLIDWKNVANIQLPQCRLHTENQFVSDCGICEIFLLHSRGLMCMLFGHVTSSYATSVSVDIYNNSGQVAREVLCAVTPTTVIHHCTLVGLLPMNYAANSDRPPIDSETVLCTDFARFEKVGKIERKGWRQVYREVRSGRLFYVDSGHRGPDAHLEVFDQTGSHLGTADLQGNVDMSTVVEGRRILW